MLCKFCPLRALRDGGGRGGGGWWENVGAGRLNEFAKKVKFVMEIFFHVILNEVILKVVKNTICPDAKVNVKQ